MKTIAIIDAHGVVGAALAEHFSMLGHQVLSVDKATEETIETAVPVADAVFVVVLPLESVSALLKHIVAIAKLNTLLVHGSSIEAPSLDLDQDELLTKQLTVCHCHFHFRPEKPLCRTMFGQNITVSLQHDSEGIWQEWLEQQFLPFQPHWHQLDTGIHDQVTTISQLLHMIVSYLIATISTQTNPENFAIGLAVGGPPFRLLLRSLLRTAAAPGVIAAILQNHPYTLEVTAVFSEALHSLKETLNTRNTTAIITTLTALRSQVGQPALADWDTTTNQLIRLDADIGTCEVTFTFSSRANATGLLANVLYEFDVRNIDKTTTIAQTNPDGSCTFRIGVTEITNTVHQAIAAIQTIPGIVL